MPLASTANQLRLPSGSRSRASDVELLDDDDDDDDKGEFELEELAPLFVTNSTSLPAAGALSSSSAVERAASRAGRAEAEADAEAAGLGAAGEAERGLRREEVEKGRERGGEQKATTAERKTD